MRFKLDENLGSRSARLFPEAGHDVESIFEEGLSGGARDELIFAALSGGGTLQNANFGLWRTQSNSARRMQLSMKLYW